MFYLHKYGTSLTFISLIILLKHHDSRHIPADLALKVQLKLNDYHPSKICPEHNSTAYNNNKHCTSSKSFLDGRISKISQYIYFFILKTPAPICMHRSSKAAPAFQTTGRRYGLGPAWSFQSLMGDASRSLISHLDL